MSTNILNLPQNTGGADELAAMWALSMNQDLRYKYSYPQPQVLTCCQHPYPSHAPPMGEH